MHTITLASGLLVLTVAWATPGPDLVAGPFSAHMIMHMGVVALAAPLIAHGVSGGWFDPVRSFPRLFDPIAASLIELVVVWGWHAPALHRLARHSVEGLVLEQVSFLVSGFLLWASVFGADRERRRRAAVGVVALLLTSMHMTLLGALLALATRPLYHHHAASAAATLADQELGGAIMLLLGGLSYLLGGLAVAARLLRDVGAPSRVAASAPDALGALRAADQERARVSS